MIYHWRHPDWPDFRYDLTGLQDLLFTYAERTGRITGALAGLNSDDRAGLTVDVMVAEALKTSAIEGEMISREDIRSSVRNQLGLNPVPEAVGDARARGVANLMVDMRRTYAAPLSKAMVFDWHKNLMAHDLGVTGGAWRTHEGPMQVVSGPIGRETVHFEAPPSQEVPAQMNEFIAWFNRTAPDGPAPLKHAPVRAAIAHLYFESIHPFEDGNGRIGRAISEKALAQGLAGPSPLSLSNVIEGHREAYYAALKAAQRSIEITAWLDYFLRIILEAQVQAEKQIAFVIAKARLFDQFRDRLTDRALKVVRRMLAEGPDGFKGGMNARKYMSLTGVSKATATRDLQELVELGLLVPAGAGRSRSYAVRLPRVGPGA